jgi:hypothetical protein
MTKKKIDINKFEVGDTIQFSSKIPLLVHRWGRIEEINQNSIRITEIVNLSW